MSETQSQTTIASEVKSWALGVHLSALVGLVIPFGNILAPLVIWLVKRESDPYIDEQGKEAVNFNISVAIYAIAAGILTVILIGFLLLAAVAIFWVAMIIIGAVRANNGEHFRYPLSIRLIK